MWQLKCKKCDQLITNIMKALRCNSKCNCWYHSSCVYGIQSECSYWNVSKEHWICDNCKANFNKSTFEPHDDLTSSNNNELLVMQLFNNIQSAKTSTFEAELNCVKVKMDEMNTQSTDNNIVTNNFITDGAEKNTISFGNVRFGFYIDQQTNDQVKNSIPSFNFSSTDFHTSFTHLRRSNCKLNDLSNDHFAFLCPPQKKFKYE